jgi:hypothetical protein
MDVAINSILKEAVESGRFLGISCVAVGEHGTLDYSREAASTDIFV